MRRTDASTGQHRNWKLGRHSHINCDAVSLLNSERLQDIGELLNFAMELLVSESSNLSGFALPNNCSFIFAGGLHMPIETVIGNVELASDEPLCPRVVPFEDAIPFSEPVQLTGNFSPKFFGLFHRFAVDALIVFKTADVGMRAELGGGLEFTLLLKYGVNVGARRRNSHMLGHAALEAMAR